VSSHLTPDVEVVHRESGTRLMLPATTVIDAMGAEIRRMRDGMDAHDDEVERRLLVRLENESLLKDGMTADDARYRLDA